MRRLFLRPDDVLSPSHTDAIPVVGVPIMPAEPLRWLWGLEVSSSSLWRLLRRRQKKIAIPARIAAAPSTPTTTPTVAPVLSPWLDVLKSDSALDPAVGVGVTVTVCRLTVPPAVTVLIEVLGNGVVVVVLVLPVFVVGS